MVYSSRRGFIPRMQLAAMLILVAVFGLSGCFGGGSSSSSGSREPSGTMAAFTTSGPSTAGEPQSFDASDSDGSGLIYRWDFGDGDAGNGARIAHVYDSAGTYSVVLKVTDASGNAATATRTIDVTAAPAPVAGDGSIAGTVVDTNGDALENVHVSLVNAQSLVGGARNADTDASGEVDLIDMPTGVEFVLKLTRDGYAERFVRTTIPADTTGASFAATMIARAATQTLAAAENGGTVSGTDGTKIDLPAGSLVDGDGNPVSGDVEITLTPVDVSREDTLAAFPGTFAASDVNGDSGMLVSYGVAEFDLTQNGEELQLADDEEATLTIPIYVDQHSDGTAVSLGDTIPLWALDESTGEWVQEGTGTVVANSDSPTGFAFEIRVGHFSWFNCDAFIGDPYQPIPACKVSSGSGYPELDISETCFIRGSTASGGPSSGVSTNIPGGGGVILPVPADTDFQFTGSARNGTLRGQTTVNGASGVEETIEIILEPIDGGSGEAITLPYDDVGAIDTVGAVDSYTFDGLTDEIVRVAVDTGTDSDLEGQVRLLAPDGQSLATGDFAPSYSGSEAAIIGGRLPADGVYVIEVDGTANEPGAYDLAAEVIPEIAIDENLEGTVPTDGGEVRRAFQGTAGTVIGVRDAGERYAIDITVSDLEETVEVANESASRGMGELPADGMYIVTIRDVVSSDGTLQSYRTAVASIDPPQDLSFDSAGRATVSGNIQVYGDRQFYRMTATAGDGMSAELRQASTDGLVSEIPGLAVFQPDGTPFNASSPIASSAIDYNTGDGPQLYSMGLRLPGTGLAETYLLEVSAESIDGTSPELGAYNLRVDTAPAQATIVVDDDLAECPAADTRSIHAAAYAVTDGGTIDVCTGRYSEHIGIRAPERAISIVGRNRAGVVLSAERTGLPIVGEAYNSGGGVIGLESLTLETRDSYLVAGVGGILDVTVEAAPDETVASGEIGVYTDGAVIDGLDMTAGYDALDIRASDTVIRNSVITGAPGTIRWQFANNALFENNTVSSTGVVNPLLRFSDGGGVQILNNTITAASDGSSYSDNEVLRIEDDGTGNTGAIVRGNTIETGMGGLYLDADDSGAIFTIEQNLVRLTSSNGSQALEAFVGNVNAQGATTVTVRNNVFDGIAPFRGGLQVWPPQDFAQVDIINNTLRAPDQGLSTSTSGGFVEFTTYDDLTPGSFPIRFINNVLEGPNDVNSTAILIEPGMTIDADHNIFHEFGTNYGDGTTSTGTSDQFNVDPQFTNMLLEVDSLSPAVDAGQETMTGGPPIPDTDYDGTARPQGATWDIGAHEHEP